MKAISFAIPNTGDESIRMQLDDGEQFYSKFHAHQETQISWIIEGSGNLLVEHNIIPFEEDSLFILGPGMPHVFKTDDTQIKYVRTIGLYFDPFTRMAAFFNLPECAKLKPLLDLFKLGGIIDRSLVRFISDKLLEMNTQQGMNRLFKFMELLQYLSDHNNKIKPINTLSAKSLTGNIDKRIQRVIEFSFTHYQKNIKLEEIASLVNMSIPSFCRFFKWSTGKSYITYLNGLRVSQAGQLLRTSTISISEVAFLCGFNYIQHFNRTFKSVKGLTPKQFRNLSY